jgi:DNA-binding XRE family transcriptional regulator
LYTPNEYAIIDRYFSMASTGGGAGRAILTGCPGGRRPCRQQAASLEFFMYAHNQLRSDVTVQELRRAAGLWLKELRERRGLSQRQLAKLVGAEYYTFISQLETGRGRIPPDRYREWAQALKIDPAEFVRTLMKYYDPVTFSILFGDAPDQTTAQK